MSWVMSLLEFTKVTFHLPIVFRCLTEGGDKIRTNFYPGLAPGAYSEQKTTETVFICKHLMNLNPFL